MDFGHCLERQRSPPALHRLHKGELANLYALFILNALSQRSASSPSAGRAPSASSPAFCRLVHRQQLALCPLPVALVRGLELGITIQGDRQSVDTHDHVASFLSFQKVHQDQTSRCKHSGASPLHASRFKAGATFLSEWLVVILEMSFLLRCHF